MSSPRELNNKGDQRVICSCRPTKIADPGKATSLLASDPDCATTWDGRRMDNYAVGFMQKFVFALNAVDLWMLANCIFSQTLSAM